MAIKNDLTHLPAATASKTDGTAPDSEPRFAGILADAWRERERAEGDKPRAFPDARFRHSDAGGCARSIAFSALDLPATNPMDLSGYWNTGLGTLIHELWQDALAARWPDATIEPKVRTVGAAGAGHIDAVVTDQAGRVIAVELKTCGGFAYKMAVGERGAPQGPKREHILQAALNGLAVDADEIVIVYLSKEAISVAAANRKKLPELARFAAEWTIQRDVFEPLAVAEAERVAGILALLDDGELPRRRFPVGELPTGHEIIDPATGRWEVRGDENEVLDTGTWWACGYCRHQDRCAATTAGRIPTSAVVSIGEVA